MRCRCPQRNYPAVSGEAIVPVDAMLRAAAADQVERKQKDGKDRADRDRNVECCEVAVDVLLKKRIIQVGCALLDS